MNTKTNTKIRPLHLFHITRPYCSPSGFFMYAYDKKDAIMLVNEMFGHASGTTAKEVRVKRGALISNEVNTNYSYRTVGSISIAP